MQIPFSACLLVDLDRLNGREKRLSHRHHRKSSASDLEFSSNKNRQQRWAEEVGNKYTNSQKSPFFRQSSKPPQLSEYKYNFDQKNIKKNNNSWNWNNKGPMVLKITKIILTKLVVFPFKCFIGQPRAKSIHDSGVCRVYRSAKINTSFEIHLQLLMLLLRMQTHQKDRKQSYQQNNTHQQTEKATPFHLTTNRKVKILP